MKRFMKVWDRWSEKLQQQQEQKKLAQHLVYVVSEYVKLLSDGVVTEQNKAMGRSVFEAHLKKMLAVDPRVIEYACEHRFWDVSRKKDNFWDHMGDILDQKDPHDLVPSILICGWLSEYGFLKAYQNAQGTEQLQEDLQSYWKVPKRGLLKRVIQRHCEQSKEGYKIQTVGCLEVVGLWIKNMDNHSEHGQCIEQLLDGLNGQPMSAPRQIVLQSCMPKQYWSMVQSWIERNKMSQALDENEKLCTRGKTDKSKYQEPMGYHGSENTGTKRFKGAL